MQPSAVVLAGLIVASSVPVASAQTVTPSSFQVAPAAVAISDGGEPAAPGDAMAGEDGAATPSFFESIGHDFTGFFSRDTFRIVGGFAVAGLAAHPIDAASVERARARLPQSAAAVGNWIGSLPVQAGLGFAVVAVGHASDQPWAKKSRQLGGDLIRAQIVTQTFVQGTKYAVGRERPDASNSRSFPSGHTASAFATARVFQQHFGWRAAVPAYAVAGFVGASRMASGKHYLSDVLVGAGIGIAGGRTVTLRLGRDNFAVGAAPTAGGAMVTLTKR